MSENLELATFAGGCFWCTEAIFKRVKGVVTVTSGYAGGLEPNPTYEKVSQGDSGFAEAIQIKFDPQITSFDKLLEIFWATHDPTTLNRQGSDVGAQYRSVIFYHNDDQREKALKSKELEEKSGHQSGQIVTKIEPFTSLYTAEEYHQNYYERNKNSNPYCSIVISPKIQKLLDKFKSDVKDEYLRSN